MEFKFFKICFCYFWLDNSLLISNLFISEYADKFLHGRSWRKYFQQSSRQKSFFQATQIRNDTIFELIHQVIRAFPRSKKIWIDQWLRKWCTLEKIWVKLAIGKQMRLVQNLFWGTKGCYHPWKVLQFILSFNLVSSVPRNCFINTNISFS